MLRFLTVFLIIVSASLHANDTIPNSGFEYWEDETTPIGWETTNQYTEQIGITPITRTEDSHSGSYAIRLETLPAPFGQSNIPGSATLGDITMDSAMGGVGISGKPTRMKGYYKHLTSGDEVNILLHAFANNDTYSGTIGFGQITITEMNEEFEQFSFDINYYNEYMPDSINVVIITNVDSSESSLIVDDLTLDFTTSVETVQSDNIHIYPNPASDHIKINAPVAEGKYKIYDINGSPVQKGEYSDNIPVSGLSPGIYQLVIENGEIRRYKFIKE